MFFCLIIFRTGLPVHFGAGEHQQRPDPADHPEHQERPGVAQPDPRQPGAAVHRQHRQQRNGRNLRHGDPQTARLRVSL